MRRKHFLRNEKKQEARFETLFQYFVKGKLAPIEVWNAWCKHSYYNDFNISDIIKFDNAIYYKHIEFANLDELKLDLQYLSDRFMSVERVNCIRRIYKRFHQIYFNDYQSI